MVRNLRELLELWSRIKTQTAEVAEYEQAIARLSGTIDDECMSTIEARRQVLQTELEDKEERYRTTAKRSHPKCLPEDSSLTAISITELSQAISAEVKALEDVTAVHFSLVQLTTNRAGLEQELRNIRQAKERTQTKPIDSMDAMEDDNEIQDLERSIEEYADKIREHESLVISLHQKAWVAMRAANFATKSDIEVSGIGRWSPIPAPGTTTATPTSAPTSVTTATTASDVVTVEPITVSTAQVEVAKIPPDVKAAAKDFQTSAALDVVATVPRSMTATIKVDKGLSDISICLPRRQYTDVKGVEKDEFKIGDIGWFPVLRPSLSASPTDIHTEFGYICAKSYPLIVINKLEDCMIGLIISTSNGNGLRLKSSSVKRRSVPVVSKSAHISCSSDWGQDLHPRKMLRVESSSGYIPPIGAYIDMLNVIMIPYDSRFQIKGRILGEDALALRKMMLSAALIPMIPQTVSDVNAFFKWLGDCASKAKVGEALIPVLQQMANSRRSIELEKAQKKK
ncbi:unnamed protein product [Alternaria burnsii]|nr:unnamed protein product [Alternaria burnsii]